MIGEPSHRPAPGRDEDIPLIRGLGGYLDDLAADGALHLAVVRSPFAHARVLRIDSHEAAGAPGVRLVLVPADVAELPITPRPDPTKRIPERFPLVQGVARAVGDPVAAVVVETPAQAVDAVGLVFVDFEPLPVAGDPEQALEAPPIYPEFGDNLAFERGGGDKADVDALGDGTVIEGTVEHPRLIPAPLEPRGCMAEWDGDRLTVHWGNQAPALMAEELAWIFDLPQEQIRVVVPDMGGAFGCKFDLAEEEVLVVEAARRLQRPVKWVESRREHMLAIGHGRAQRHYYKAVADADGKVRGLWVDSIVDVGARKRYLTGPPVTPRIGAGNYDIPVYAWRQRGVFTNRAPMGIYRGAGRPEATLTVERIMDRVALATGLDPVEVRRRNFVREFPHESRSGWTYDSGDYGAAVDKLLATADYGGLRARQEELRGQGRYVGIGIAAYVEACGFEASEVAEVRVAPDGAVEVLVGTLDHGQGHRTTFAALVADVLGVSPDRVAIVQGDTAIVPFGYGTSGSRSGAHGGSSALGAAERVAEKAARIAAHLIEADPADIVFRDGRVEVRGSPGIGMTWEELAAAAHDPDQLPPGEHVGLSHEHTFESGGLMFPFGMHLALVEVDADTGRVDLQDVWAVDDCGTILNPMIVEGQRHGGLAQGIGQALWELVVYDEDGNLLTGSFADYLVPAADQLPSFRLDATVTPTPHNPLGAKGVAEVGTIGITPAVVNAVFDALRPFGIEHLDVPLRPDRVWAAIQSAPGVG
ncbi:MAG: xanthine dehydrogenase family protein molybdopterin-binding subunit [Acidimicrobiia bacterium]